ncbi:hypothetical protein [Arenimonas metalli]|uniref:Uncharacterized protein n=1 Tax=Arenimonas metalli CF5-1 TaxID=1384056 RepID=A0A091BQE0_9GAMM|nr:hypothetical protein [Arenimonas metalli]KFN46550.1 hypothetical protein N787_09990 [Arenimonas metalli CF5-1]
MLAIALTTTLALSPAPPVAEERVFQQASQLQPWCRQEAEAHFTGRGIETYQWTASYSESGRMLEVRGTLRAGGQDVAVTCRIAKGARERYASIRIDPA